MLFLKKVNDYVHKFVIIMRKIAKYEHPILSQSIDISVLPHKVNDYFHRQIFRFDNELKKAS